MKISLNSESHKTEHMLDQISPGPSRPQSKINSVHQDQESEIKSKLSVLRSGIIIDSSLKNKINSLLREESLYSDIFVELDSGKNEVKRKGEVYKRKGDLLVVHQEGQNSDVGYWRVIIPDDVSTRNFVVTELHNIPYSLHLGVQRTLYKVRKHFFWKGMTGHIREFVESCPVCQVAKSGHTLNRGKLQSTNIPEKSGQKCP